jgi:hypothetical protein
MSAAYVAVTILTIVANTGAALADFTGATTVRWAGGDSPGLASPRRLA